MCAERIQRFLMAFMLILCMVLFMLNIMNWAVILQSFIILMVLLWAIADFCPSLWVFKKIFGSCDDR